MSDWNKSGLFRQGRIPFTSIVDHHRRMLAATSSFYGAQNDKMIVRHDTYITDVKNKKVHENVEYTIFINKVPTTVKGVYHICDVNPVKHTISRSDRLWSEWVESVRKDVESTFGILKSRWCFLRNVSSRPCFCLLRTLGTLLSISLRSLLHY
jgi:Plant transposon protein